MARKLRLCYYADPNSIHTRRWLTFFVSRGHEVTLISDFEARVPIPNVRSRVLHVNTSRAPARWLERRAKFRRFLKQIGPDILHAHFMHPYGYWAAASGFHPFVATPWGSDLLALAKESLWLSFLTRRALKTADLVTVESVELGQAAARLGASLSKIHRVLWGVDYSLFDSERDAVRIRSEFGISNSDFVILSMRNLRPVYNHSSVIKAVPEILKEVPNAVFLFVGSGEQKDELESLAAGLGIIERVKVLGEQPNERVPDLMALADLYISIPSSDSISTTLLEAMASGKAVVVSNLPATREWIRDGENGLVIFPEPKAVAEAVLTLATDESMRRGFGERNRELVRKNADHTANMMKMEELYYSLVIRSGR